MLARKVGSLLRHWPRWSLLLVLGRHFDVVEEFCRCESEFPRKRARSAAASEEDVFEFRRAARAGMREIPGGRVDVVLVLLCLSVALLLVRHFATPVMVDRFLGTGIALSALGIVVGFLFGVTGIQEETRLSKVAQQRQNADVHKDQSSSARSVLLTALQNAVLLGCFIVSTAPFTLPWLLAYFFPFELLCFAVFFTVILEVGNQVSALCHAPPGADYHQDQILEGDGTAQAQEESIDSASVSKDTSPSEFEDKIDQTRKDEKRRKYLKAYLLSDSGREWCGAFIALECGVIGFASLLSFVWELLLVWNLSSSATDELGSTRHHHILQSKTKHFAGLDWQMSYVIVMCGVGSTSAFLQAFWLTYAAGGRWLHFANGWAFFQPLRGGPTFVFLQVVAWSLYGVCLSLSVERLAPVILGALSSAFGMQLSSDLIAFASSVLWVQGSLARFVGATRLLPGAVGALYVFAEIVMVLSLSQFKRFERDEGLVREVVTTKHRGARVQSLVREREAEEGHFLSGLRDIMRTVFMTCLAVCSVEPHIILSGVSVCFFHLFGDGATSIYAVCTCGAIYLTTYLGNPSIKGTRRLEPGSFLFRIVEDHFSLSMVRTSEEPWDPEQEYICGYHPHGLVPLGAAYMKMTPQWSELLPNILPFTLSASITHQVPILRDFVQLSGGLEVSKKGIWAGLNRFRSVVLVPGGQHEMLLAPSRDLEGVEEPISTKHKGFVRIAFRRAARQPDRKLYLVPIFAFGDRRALRNLPLIPKRVQRWFVRRMRTNPAMFPVGRFSLPCIPDRGPVTIVLGDPIEVPVLKGGERAVPTEEQVDLFHRRYYSRLKDIFDEHKGVHGNQYETAEMVFVPELETVSETSFEAQWAKVAHDHDDEEEEDTLDFEREIDESIYVWPWREQILVVFIVIFASFGPIAALSILSSEATSIANITLPTL